jgi:hypothetical protein
MTLNDDVDKMSLADVICSLVALNMKVTALRCNFIGIEIRLLLVPTFSPTGDGVRSSSFRLHNKQVHSLM